MQKLIKEVQKMQKFFKKAQKDAKGKKDAK